MAEQTFVKDRSNFMKAYTKETEKPFGYIVLDNHPRTTSDKQVVADVFGHCYTYPHTTKSPALSQNTVTSESTVEAEVQPKLSVKRKVELPTPTVKKRKRESVKNKADNKQVKKQKKPATKRKVKNKQAKKQTAKRKSERDNKPTKKLKKESKPQTRKPRRLAVYQPEFNQEKEDEYNSEEEQSSSEDEQVHSDEEQIHSEDDQTSSDEEPRHCTRDELNELAKQGYRSGQQGGSGPKVVFVE